MTSIDDLFKYVPGSYRDAAQLTASDKAFKSAKHDSNGHAGLHARPSAFVADEEEGDTNDDVEAGPSMPPDEEGADYRPDIPDDEEGRFFGGGTTHEENEMLDYMDAQEPADALLQPDTFDAAWVRRLALSFERKISANAALRAKFEDQPERFMSSEADLDAEIKTLSLLTEHPHLYPEFARLGSAASLVALLAHENADVAIDALEIIAELTHEDVGAEEADWDALVDKMLEADLLGLLASTLTRLDETHESDRHGVYHALAILEDLASRAEIAQRIGESEILLWLVRRAARAEKVVSQNKASSAEVLAILLQSNEANRHKVCELRGLPTSSGKGDSVELLLEVLAMYRKKDPTHDSDEVEFAENMFASLTLLLSTKEGRDAFLAAEGIELLCLMISQGHFSRDRALRMLDHALSGNSGAVETCTRLVEAAGLKTVFGCFIKTKKQSGEALEHLLSIFASLLRWLPANEPARIRTLVKFVEKDYEKVDRLLDLRKTYAARLGAVEEKIRQEQASLDAGSREDMTDEWLSRRFDAGLFSLQMVDVILSWLIAEDDGAARRIDEVLAQGGQTRAVLKSTLQEQVDAIAVSPSEADTMTRDMLTTLLQFVS